MKALFDTSVLVAALVEGHPRHADAWPWLEAASEGALEGAVSLHGVAELYAVLTVLPSLRPRPTPHEIVELVRRSVTGVLAAVGLDATDYEEAIRRAADRGVRGGGLYDALIEQAARDWGAELLLTLNRADFVRLADEDSPRIADPAEESPRP